MFMKLLFLSILTITFGDDVIISSKKNNAAIVFLPSQGMQAKQYSDILGAIQWSLGQYSSGAWVGIIGDNPSSDAGVQKSIQRVLSNMQSQGLSSSPALFLGAHSPAQGMIMQSVAVNGTSSLPSHSSLGILLFGAFMNRYSRPFTKYPVLTVGGELDGVARVTRVGAEEYYHQQMRSNSISKVQDNPVVILEKLSHMSFASGSPSDFIQSLDLKPEVDEKTAHDTVGRVAAAFIAYHTTKSDGASRYLQYCVENTGNIVSHVIDVMEYSGNHRLRQPCESDHPTNPSCQYTKWPDQSLPPFPKPAPNPPRPMDCMCGSSFVEDTAQRLMAGFEQSPMSYVACDVKDSFHDVSDTRPFHLPHIFNSCQTSDKSCTLNSTTVTMPIYKDTEDDGFSPLAAFEYRTKLKSRQAMWQAAGMAADDVNATDGSLSICRSINEASLQYALNQLPQAALDRYRSEGEPLVMVDDVVATIGITGPQWIKDEMVYKRTKATGSTPTQVTVQSWTFKTSNYNRGNVPYIVTAGYHYCKILSPFKAMEWMLVDSFRQYHSLANRTRVAKSRIFA